MASVLSSCGGGFIESKLETLSQRGASADFQESQEVLDAKWAAALVNPGTPGVDYDPQRITVAYKLGVHLPAHLVPPVGMEQAAGEPNAIIRVNSQFEQFTDSISSRFGITIGTQVYWKNVNIACFEIPEGVDGDKLIADINSDYIGLLEYATYSRLFHRAATVPDPWFNDSDPTKYSNGSDVFSPQWGQKRIGCNVSFDNPGQPGAWDITKGSGGVRIAVCDTGVNRTHEALTDTVLEPGVDIPDNIKLNVYSNPDNNNTNDLNGHGTFISGLVAAKSDNKTIVGVAPDCRVVPIKIAGSQGLAWDGDMYAGCVLAVQPLVGCKVVNLSFGGSTPTPTLQALVNDVADEGALLFVAAGNAGTTQYEYPAAYAAAFAIGSSTRTDTRSSFSNYGDNLDLCAPGQNLGSCDTADTDGYYYADGTSFAAPIAAAVAGLMWTVKPSLTRNEVRQIMIDTGVTTTGFTGSVPRVNAAAAVAAAAGMQIKAGLPQLISRGTITLTPEVAGLPDRIEAYFDGTLVGSDDTAPFEFQIDTSGVLFGTASVEFRGFQGVEQKSEFLQLAIDNTTATFPMLEGFETFTPSLLPFDAQSLEQGVMDNMYNLPGGDESTDIFRTQGPGNWRTSLVAPFKGGNCAACIQDSGSHGSYEVDSLISRQLAIPATGSPTLVFYHHYNLEKGASNEGFDRGWVLVTTDGGLTFTAAKKKGGTPGSAWFSGEQAGWWKGEVDLAEFAGQSVNIVFCLQTDGQVQGHNAAAPAGWWIDAVAVATNYNESVPLIGGVNVENYSLYGAVPSKPEMELQIEQPTDVNKVTYIVDCAPFGVTDAYDLKVDVTGQAPWQVQVTVPQTLPNQLAHLRVQYFNSANVAGPEVVVPIWLFNKPGDVNADGDVDQLDLDAFPAMVGLAEGDSGYVPFFDTDLDGKVRENDASAIGYFWGN
ncbi:MAG: S8 family serine peptidase [bacterium]|nr:S8 family serine peptidase [bacterium]